MPYEEKLGYQAFSSVVHHASGIFESDSPDVARAKLEQSMHELVPLEERPDTLRYLLLLLGLAPDDEVRDGRLHVSVTKFSNKSKKVTS